MFNVKCKWPKVIGSADYEKPLLQWIDLGNGSMFRMAAFFTSDLLPPCRGLFIGIERVGCFFFHVNQWFHWSYVGSKLGLPESDARNLSDWMNEQCGFIKEQQGVYVEDKRGY